MTKESTTELRTWTTPEFTKVDVSKTAGGPLLLNNIENVTYFQS